MQGWIRQHGALAALVVLSLVLLLPGLAGPSLWQDEAETALLARSILNHGFPLAWDGGNLITQLSGNDSTPAYVWHFTPWLPFYLVAASFRLFGESNLAGRMPFVIIGIMGVVATYLFAFSLSRSRFVAGLSGLLLAVNMQFLIHTRQCKYYALLFLLPTAMFWAYTQLGKRAAAFAVFVAGVVFTFHTNYVALFNALVGLTVLTLLVRRERSVSVRFVAAGAIAMALTVPFFLLGDFGTSASLISRLPSFWQYLRQFGRHVWAFNGMAFALLLFIPLVAFYRRRLFSEEERGIVRFLMWIILPAWLALPLFDAAVIRYNLFLIPLLCILLALMVQACLRWSRVAGVVFLALLLATNLFANLPVLALELSLKATGAKMESAGEAMARFDGKKTSAKEYFRQIDEEIAGLTLAKAMTRFVLKSEYAAYANEMTGNWQDGIAAVAKVLREQAKPGEIVYGNFDTLSLLFYLPELRFAYSVDPAKLIFPKDPPLPAFVTTLGEVDWYYDTDVELIMGPHVTEEAFLALMRKRGKTLTPYPTGVSDLFWDINWPQHYEAWLNKMLWREKPDAREIVVYRVGGGREPRP